MSKECIEDKEKIGGDYVGIHNSLCRSGPLSLRTGYKGAGPL